MYIVCVIQLRRFDEKAKKTERSENSNRFNRSVSIENLATEYTHEIRGAEIVLFFYNFQVRFSCSFYLTSFVAQFSKWQICQKTLSFKMLFIRWRRIHIWVSWIISFSFVLKFFFPPSANEDLHFFSLRYFLKIDGFLVRYGHRTRYLQMDNKWPLQRLLFNFLFKSCFIYFAR